MIKTVFKRLLYTVYPKRCKLCGEVIKPSDELCSECLNAKKISGKICEKCGMEKAICECKKQKHSPRYKAVCAPYYYEGSMERAVRRLKNYSFCELAPAMAEEIAKTVRKRFEGVSFDVVTSVPMTKKKQRERGYNQSELLAIAVAEKLGSEYKPLLVKTKNTDSQRYSSASRRRVNLYGAFEIADGAQITGKTILIVDDVKTTGSTLSECAQTLRGSKPEAVYAAAFTLTKPHK